MDRKEGKYCSEDILEGIGNHDREILNHVYKTQFHSICRYVETRHGNDADAWDIFQEAIGVVYDLVKNKEPKLELTSSFETFFYAVAKRLWLKQLRNRNNNPLYFAADLDNVGIDLDELEAVLRMNELFSIYMKQIENLDAKCRKAFELSVDKTDGKSMAKQLRFFSAQAAYNKKRECIKKLINLIINDPDYKKLNDYEKP